VEKEFAAELLERVAQSKPIARKLDQIAKQRTPVKFSGIYRGRLESAITELVTGRACMTSDTDSQWRRC